MSNIRISFPASATAGVSFEIDANQWDSIDHNAQEQVMMHMASKANELLGMDGNDGDGEVSVNTYILRMGSIDFRSVEVDRYSYDSAVEEGTRYERAFGDRSELG